MCVKFFVYLVLFLLFTNNSILLCSEQKEKKEYKDIIENLPNYRFRENALQELCRNLGKHSIKEIKEYLKTLSNPFHLLAYCEFWLEVIYKIQFNLAPGTVGVMPPNVDYSKPVPLKEFTDSERQIINNYNEQLDREYNSLKFYLNILYKEVLSEVTERYYRKNYIYKYMTIYLLSAILIVYISDVKYFFRKLI